MVTLQSKIKRQLSCIGEEQAREKDWERINCRDLREIIDRSGRTDMISCPPPWSFIGGTRQKRSDYLLLEKYQTLGNGKLLTTTCI